MCCYAPIVFENNQIAIYSTSMIMCSSEYGVLSNGVIYPIVYGKLFATSQIREKLIHYNCYIRDRVT